MLTSRATCAMSALTPLRRTGGVLLPSKFAPNPRIIPRPLAPCRSAADDAAARAREAGPTAADRARETATKFRGALNQATLDLDLTKLVRWNFLVQVFLTGVSWAVVFVTSHSAAKGPSLNPVTITLLAGVALAGWSAYLSFSYLTKANKEGLGALDGFAQLNAFYEHATYNFIGAGTALIALFANIGTAMFASKVNYSANALTQAATNTLAAHLVSLAFLFLLIRKITRAYQKLADWSAQLEQLRANMPKL